ncbi:unnamed protein product [Rhizoctonia solani]|uniref:Peptidase C14 caspase domain-containing protein n=1 Tax=Rhizoctonia solani TaxID=456999 RepID=A0A8H3CDU9_9AGAM|nr:unnamed protein product [Rhizoctonia solani]
MTNTYEDMMWPGLSGSEGEMTLRGAIEDRRHARKFLGKFNPEIEVKQVDEALRKDIQDQIGKCVDSSLSLLVAYIQGHGQITNHTVQYITGDRKKGSLEGLTAEELIEMFSRFSAQTMLVAITDFCHSGNVYRLPFRLVIGIDGTGYWDETGEWNHDDTFSRKNRINSPMLHIAGSLRQQYAYETRMRGGYFTNVCTPRKRFDKVGTD